VERKEGESMKGRKSGKIWELFGGPEYRSHRRRLTAEELSRLGIAPDTRCIAMRNVQVLLREISPGVFDLRVRPL